ncbi:chemotaxis protein [Megalodesulfovibrio gigas]|uniref:Putative response regulator n=1 Tax=Megalodesulfovibrio gigas (strain ATCC 19364 / DSM 1382 / NCIMB 9332 / VKM B-1759) TaxID=1121448 RepID=T2GAK2_MEGG1|nr:chemotaxis protein [Megalodesulfovibrio gigas]AGW12947.1 putative response regulator [Megalodesulfovibrio gigas DSM 1382 = ATCC 19364]
MAQTNILLEAGTNELEVVEFYLEEAGSDTGGESKTGKSASYRGYYGVNVAKVLEIIRMPNVTELPEASNSAILGAFNQRNNIIPLVDLSIWLGKQRAENEAPKVIVTEFNDSVTAFMVSGVTRIHRISWESVEPPNEYMAAMSDNSITGVVRLEDRIVFLLDLEKIVTDLNPALGLKLDEAIDWSTDIRYRAIVADDSGVIREMMRDLLEKAGFDVTAFTNGRDAWETLQRIAQAATEQGRPVRDFVHVLVSDIEMPQMDGHHLTKRIKEDPVLRDLPIMLFSSLITDKLRHKGEAVGADDQISKPQITELAQRARALIKSRWG